jgi:hypothetical protein
MVSSARTEKSLLELQALKEAVRIAGSVAQLSKRVALPAPLLEDYLAGRLRVPARVFRESVKLLLEDRRSETAKKPMAPRK